MANSIADTKARDVELLKKLGMTYGALRVLVDDGLPLDALQWPVDDAEFRKRIIPIWLAGGYAPATHHRVVALSMPQGGYWGLEDWLGGNQPVKLIKTQRKKVEDIPITEGLLNSPCPVYKDQGKRIRDTHFVVLMLEWITKEDQTDLNGLRKMYPGPEHPKVYYVWSDQAEYTKVACKVGWHVMLKGAVPGSQKLAFPDMCKLLPPGYKVSRPEVRAWVNVLYRKKNPDYLDPSWVACDEEVSGRRIVVVGLPDNGVNVNNWNGNPNPNVGLAASAILKLIFRDF